MGLKFRILSQWYQSLHGIKEWTYAYYSININVEREQRAITIKIIQPIIKHFFSANLYPKDLKDNWQSLFILDLFLLTHEMQLPVEPRHFIVSVINVISKMCKLHEKNSIASYMVPIILYSCNESRGLRNWPQWLARLPKHVLLTLKESKVPNTESSGVMCLRKHNLGFILKTTNMKEERTH